MSRLVKIILAVNLIALTILVFVYPNLMVGPGKLIPGHHALATDCFACHAPLAGAESKRCVTCHKLGDIGRLTTTGLPISKPLTAKPFHQNLATQDCVACHSDHAGVKRFRPQGHFQHELLAKVSRDTCQNCHQSPTDSLHKQITGNCKQCHTQEKWVPATFDHDKYFQLDRDHNTKCVTCHVRNNYSRYTCYGCHEHTSNNIRREHVEEGIRDYENCVECHRSANEDDIPGKHGENKRSRDGKNERDND